MDPGPLPFQPVFLSAAAIPAMDKVVQATDDFKEGIASFIERRPAVFTGR